MPTWHLVETQPIKLSALIFGGVVLANSLLVGTSHNIFPQRARSEKELRKKIENLIFLLS